jgi:hypothetical protein
LRTVLHGVRSGEGVDHRGRLGLVVACLYLWKAFLINGVLQRQAAGAGKVEEVSVPCILSDPAIARCEIVIFNRCISYPFVTAVFIYTFYVTKEPLRGLVRFQTCELCRGGNKSSVCQKWG